uniref:Uncharacterized protein n=1 Tax=Plectus sambesii TaxID=2011161 RepID=A0A914VPV2_9BILA
MYAPLFAGCLLLLVVLSAPAASAGNNNNRMRPGRPMKRLAALYYGGGRTDLLRPGRPMKREPQVSVELRSPRTLHLSKFKNPLAGAIYARSLLNTEE